jgi:hypothetical protein
VEELEELPLPASFGQVSFVDVDVDVDLVTVAGRVVDFEADDACARPVNPVMAPAPRAVTTNVR